MTSTNLETLFQEGQKSGEIPIWQNLEGFSTLSRGYLLPGETPKGMYRRLAKAAAKILGLPKKREDEFFNAFWSNWICPASPVCSNFGTTRGLPISCLAGDSWINTPEGGVQIADLEVGQTVLTHNGRWREVVDKKVRMSSDDLWELKVNSRCTPTKITGNHPVLTNEGWVRVDEIDTSRHLIAVNDEMTEAVEEKYVLNLSRWIDYNHIIDDGLIKKTSTNKLSRKRPKNGLVGYYAQPVAEVEVDEEVAWAIGLWLAEGSRTINDRKEPNGIRITMHVDETPHVERFLEIMKRRFNLNGDYYASKVIRNGRINQWVTANVNGGVIGRCFTDLFSDNSKTKRIPTWAQDLPVGALESLWDGLMLGDGSYRPDGTVQFTVSSPHLLLGTYNIALKLGKRVSLQMQTKAGKLSSQRYVYTLKTLRDYNEKSRYPHIKSGIKFGNLRYFMIHSLKKLDHNENVYDITVDEDHSFSVAGVVVHNCYSSTIPDSVDGIFKTVHETAMLSKHGGGLGHYWGEVRGRGQEISGNNGECEGILPWLKIEDTVISSVSQGGVRRGSSAQYLPVSHPDIDEFIDVRRQTGDESRRCRSVGFHHAVIFDDDFMHRVEDGDEEARRVWSKFLRTRWEMGEPYAMFGDNANNQAPDIYKDRGLKITTSNLCNEIYLYTDDDHTFVCCLSSMNLARYDEWKDTNAVQLAVWFLDAIMSDFIEQAGKIEGFERAVRFAEASRALGLGALGWHTLLQSKMLPFESFGAMQLNNEVWRYIQSEATAATKDLAEAYGEPDWCKGYGVRNTHLTAVAPTLSNSILSGGVSEGIQPNIANVYANKTAKGTFLRRNPALEALLESKAHNNEDTWRKINADRGSVKHLNFLSDDEKSVFLTAREINQFAIVRQAAQRQKYIDQGQSLNLFFSTPPEDADDETRNLVARYVHDVHMEAWRTGLKGLYYMRTESPLKGDAVFKQESDCLSCEA